MDSIINIATFVKVVEAGGFAAASRKLDLSPSTVTSHIQDLEQRLGARLLNRNTRNISLTEVGKAYYERCLQILADVDEADNVVQALQATPRGTLRLSVSIGIPLLLGPVIAKFTSLYPEVKLNMTVSDRMVDMIEEGVDLAISLFPIPESRLIVRRVGSYRVQVWGSPSYFEAHGLLPDWPGFLDDFQRHWPTDEDHTYVEFVRDGIAGNGAARLGNAHWRRLTEERTGAEALLSFAIGAE